MNKFLISTIIISTLILAGGVMYVAQKNSQSKEADVNVGVVEKPSISKPSQVTDSTADWKVYRDWKEYQSAVMGFSLKYPPFWKVSPEVQGEEGRRVKFEVWDGDDDNWFSSVIIIQGYKVFSYDKNRYLTFDEIVESERLFAQDTGTYFGFDFREGKILLDNRLAVVFSYMEWIERKKEWCWIKTIFEKTKSFRINLIVCDKNKNKEKEDINTLNYILNSFRFI